VRCSAVWAEANEARNRSSRQWRITARGVGSGINPPGGMWKVRKGIVNGWGGRSGEKKSGSDQGLKPSLISASLRGAEAPLFHGRAGGLYRRRGHE